MEDKIVVEFDRKKLQEKCRLRSQIRKPYSNNWCINYCKKKNKDLINCAINSEEFICHEDNGDFKIKEQSNGNKETK